MSDNKKRTIQRNMRKLPLNVHFKRATSLFYVRSTVVDNKRRTQHKMTCDNEWGQRKRRRVRNVSPFHRCIDNLHFTCKLVVRVSFNQIDINTNSSVKLHRRSHCTVMITMNKRMAAMTTRTTMRCTLEWAKLLPTASLFFRFF